MSGLIVVFTLIFVLGSILRKLHLDDHTQAAVSTWQEEIVRRGPGSKRG